MVRGAARWARSRFRRPTPHRWCCVAATKRGSRRPRPCSVRNLQQRRAAKMAVRNAAASDLGDALSAYGGAPAVEVVVTRLDVGSDALRASAALLSQEERHRASCFAFDRDRRRFTVARARLRQLLAARLDVRRDAVELVYGDSGKPALARPAAGSDLRFSVSHCDDVATHLSSLRLDVA